MISRIIIVTIIFVITSVNVYSQNRKLTKADKFFEVREYFKALDLYKEAYKNETDKRQKAYITFQEAECYRHMNNSKKAEVKYKSCIQKKYSNPLAVLYYGDMLKKNEKYEMAVEQYKEYIKLVPDDERGKRGLESCSLAAKWRKNPTRYIIKNIKDINSREMEFTPAYSNAEYNQIYFTSTRKKDNFTKFNYVSGQNFTDIFSSDLDKKGEWSNPEPINDTIDSEFDDGSPSFSSNFRTLYFTRCRVKKNEQIGCQIYKSVRQGGEDWATTEVVQIADDSISVGHPSISEDGNTLYFVSRMQGGYGGNDIWMIQKKGGKWGKPVNLGPDINTKGNEVYPYIRKNGVLYFSSDYHLGMGGLDIFKATKKGKKWTVENMKYPINSYSDDFAIIFKGEKEEGMFTSTRKITELPTDPPTVIKSRGGDDIYSFVLPPLIFSLEGQVKDQSTDKPVAGALIKLYGSDGTDLRIKTDKDGKFKYRLNPNTDYVYVISKKGYLNGKGKQTTTKYIYSKKIEKNIYLSQIEKPVEVPNILYDFGKWDLREESKAELDKLVETLNSNPNITIELGSHTDRIGDEKANIELSQKRAQSVVDYLISKGINAERLTAKGYGESQPFIVNARVANETSLDLNDTLNDAFFDNLEEKINKIKENDKIADDKKKFEIEKIQKKIDEANQANRRTEFRVLSTKYIPEIDW